MQDATGVQMRIPHAERGRGRFLGAQDACPESQRWLEISQPRELGDLLKQTLKHVLQQRNMEKSRCNGSLAVSFM